MPTERYGPVRVSNCLPTGFPTYSKLFHPIYIDPTISDPSVSWHQAADPDQMFVGIRAGGTLVRESSHGRTKGERIRWQQLSKKCGVAFHPETSDRTFAKAFPDGSWPRSLLGPDEGTLDQETCNALIAIMLQRVGNMPCFFYYSGLSVAFGPDGYLPHLYVGTLPDVLAFFDSDDVNASPEFWWPENREWCVCTDWDLSFTLIGGSRDLAAALSDDPFLEILPVSTETRVDCRSDEPSVPGAA